MIDNKITSEIVPYRSQRPKRVHKFEVARLAAIEYLTENEYVNLIKAADNYPEHKLLMRLLWETGLRIGEALNLLVTDLYPDGINVRHGKGNKQRLVPCQPNLLGELRRYADNHHQLKLFVKITTNAGALYMMRRYAKYINLGKRIHPHLFRHSFAINFLKQTGNPFALQDIGGWSDMETVKIYMRLANEMPKEAMQRMQFPQV